MTKALTQEDWGRIVHALSLFLHNPDYEATLAKVQTIVSSEGRA